MDMWKWHQYYEVLCPKKSAKILAMRLTDRRLIAELDSRWLGCQDDAGLQDNAKCHSGDQQRESKDTGGRAIQAGRFSLIHESRLIHRHQTPRFLTLPPTAGQVCVFVCVFPRVWDSILMNIVLPQTHKNTEIDLLFVSERCKMSNEKYIWLYLFIWMTIT